MFVTRPRFVSSSFVLYLASIGAVLLAYWLRNVLSAVVGGQLPPYILFYPTVMLVGVTAGFWPGVISTLLSTGMVAYLILQPRGSFKVSSPSDVVGLILFCAFGLATSWASERFRIARRKAADYEVLKLFVKDAPVGLAMFDRDMRYLAASDRWIKDCGISLNSVTGISHYDLFPDLPKHWKEAHQRGLAGETLKGEERWEALDGKSHIVRWEIYPWGDQGNDTRGIIIFEEDITERKQAENDLRANKERWATTLASIGDAVITCDENGRIDFLNASAEKLTNWSLNDSSGQKIDQVFRIVNEQNGLPAPDIAAQVLREGNTIALANHTALITKNGQSVPIEDSAAPIIDANGEIKGVVLVFHDVTERRRAVEALKDREQLLNLMGHTAKVGGWELDPTTGEGHWTDEVARIHGLDPSVRPSKELGFSFYKNESRERITKAVQAAIAHGTPYDLELEIVTANSMHKWVRTIGRPVMENGKVVKLHGSFQDITERKLVRDALIANEAKFRSYVTHAPFSFVVADTEGQIIDFNPATVEMFGYDADTLRQMNVADLHPKAERDLARGFIKTLRENKRVEGEFRLMKKDGCDLWVALRAVGVENGISLGFLTDITERKDSEKRMRLLEEEFRQSQKLEAVGRLAGGIAHDFNNLLMVIMAQTELLMKQVDDAAQQRAGKILQPARRAAELTKQLLAFSRKQTIQPTVMTLNQVLTGVSDMLKRLVGEDVEIKFALCDQPLPVKIDRSQFEQVIMNLVVNARDAMPSGGTLTLKTGNCAVVNKNSAEHPSVPIGEYAVLTVSDTGFGMSEDVKARLFEPFFTTKEVGKGTGLGLSMVYGIVKQNNGFIWVSSEPDKGASFKIYIPTASPETTPSGMETAPVPLRGQKTATVLLVEDDDALRNIICGFLETDGHKVLPAESVVDALQLAIKHRDEIDILITDVVLKGGNGKDLVRTLEGQGHTFRVVYMSGYTPDAIVQHGVLKPGTPFLQKPFDQCTLLRKIEELLS